MLQNQLVPAFERAAERRVRVLNATNGSAAATNATAAAAAIASERGAELIVVHVCAAEVMRAGRLTPTIVQQQRLRDPHASDVLSAARQVAWAHGAFARVILISGEPAPAILLLARELGVDLVVIGARRSRVPAVMTARTRCRIQRDAPCPVRVVVLSAPKQGRASLRTVPAT